MNSLVWSVVSGTIGPAAVIGFLLIFRKKLIDMQRFSGNSGIEKARADFEKAQEVEERFVHDFDGVDFTMRQGRALFVRESCQWNLSEQEVMAEEERREPHLGMMVGPSDMGVAGEKDWFKYDISAPRGTILVYGLNEKLKPGKLKKFLRRLNTGIKR